MKNNKKLNLILFVVIFGFSNVSHAGIFTRSVEAAKRWWNGADSSLDNAARDAGNGTPPIRQNPTAPSNLVTENADGVHPTRLQDFLTKVPANKNILGVDANVSRVASLLRSKSRSFVTIVAEAGTGKSALIEYMQHLIDIRSPLVQNLIGRNGSQNKQLYYLDVFKLMGGTELRGSFEKRLSQILEELSKPENAHLIIVFDELENVLNNELGVKFLESMKSYLTQKSNVKFIGNITPEPFEKLMKDPQLERRMSILHVRPPDDDVVRNILNNIKNSIEQFEGVRILSQGRDTVDHIDPLEVILKLSKLHPNLKNPDVSKKILDAAKDLAISARDSGDIQISMLKDSISKIKGRRNRIENMRSQGVASAEGPHYENSLSELNLKIKSMESVLESFNESFRRTESIRTSMQDKIIQRAALYNQVDLSLAVDNMGDVNLYSQINDLTSEIETLSVRIKDINPMLVGIDLELEHIVQAAATILKKSPSWIESRIASFSANRVAARLSGAMDGAHEEALRSIISREHAQRSLLVREIELGSVDKVAELPAFIIWSNSPGEASRIARSVSEEMTGSSPFEINVSSFPSRHEFSRIVGSPPGYSGSEVEGAIYKSIKDEGGFKVVLVNGLQSAKSYVFDFLEDILTNRSLVSNKGSRASFERSTAIATANVADLTKAQKAKLKSLTNEIEQQAYLKKILLEKLKPSVDIKDLTSGSKGISQSLLDKFYVVYVDSSFILEDGAKAIFAKNLKGTVLENGLLKRSLVQHASASDEISISLDFTDEAIDFLFQNLKNRGSNNTGEILTYVQEFLQTAVGSRTVIPGDHVVLALENNRLRIETLPWSDGSRRAQIIEASRKLDAPATPDARQNLRDALGLGNL